MPCYWMDIRQNIHHLVGQEWFLTAQPRQELIFARPQSAQKRVHLNNLHFLRWSLQVLNRPVWHSVFAGHMWEMTSRSQSGSSLAMSTLLSMTQHWHGISGNVMLRSSPRGCWSFKYRSVRGEDKTTASSAQTPALQRSMAEVKITYPHVRCSKCN